MDLCPACADVFEGPEGRGGVNGMREVSKRGGMASSVCSRMKGPSGWAAALFAYKVKSQFKPAGVLQDVLQHMLTYFLTLQQNE